MKLFFILPLLVCLLSCSKVQYLEQAFTLKSYSDGQAAIAKDVALQRKKFSNLVMRVQRGDDLSDLKSAKILIARLGQPVLKEVLENGEKWLYRDPVQYFNTSKVYFFLDQRGYVLNWDARNIYQDIEHVIEEK